MKLPKSNQENLTQNISLNTNEEKKAKCCQVFISANYIN